MHNQRCPGRISCTIAKGLLSADQPAMIVNGKREIVSVTKGCFIGIDQGSSSTKALAFSTEGQVLCASRRELSPPRHDGQRVEQDPGEVLASVRAVIDDIAGDPSTAGHPLLAAGLSCQRSSCLAWHTGTGAPLSPILSWRDTRGSALVNALAPHADEIFERTGLPLTAYYAASKLRWLRDHVPAVRESAAVLGTLSGFLCQRLTGATAPLIDHTNAARTQLMDIRSLAWSDELLRLFGLEDVALPVIVPTSHRYGDIPTPRGALPLLATLGDQQAAMLGLGVFQEGQGGINYGTGGFLMVSTGDRLVPVPKLMASVHFSTRDQIRYLVEGSVNAVGDGLAWLRTNLGLFESDDELETLCRSASSGVTVFLGLNGTGAPHWEPDIGNAIRGLSEKSSASDIIRGAVEGISFFMTDIASALESANIHARAYTVSGGLVSLHYLVQAQAALLGTPLSVSADQEASARGAAILAGIAHGTWRLDHLDGLLPPLSPVTPLQDSDLARRYRSWQALHRDLARGQT